MTDGLSDDEVNWILQDRQGFLWIHSGSGLNKFDGYVFENYLNNPTSSYILSRRATIFHQDKRGRFWILTNEGLSVFNPLTEKNDFLFPRNSFRGPIIRFRERKDGKLWICTNTHIYLVDAESFSVERLADLPSNLRYSDILQTHDGALLVNSTGGILEIDPVSNQKRIHKPPFEKRHSGIIRDFYDFMLICDRKNRIWMGTESGLLSFDPIAKSFQRYLPDIFINYVFETEDGKMWIASSKGVFVFDPDSKQYNQLTHAWSTCVIQDRQGIMWIGTLDGLWQLNPKTYRISIHREFGDLIGPIIEDSNHNILMIVSLTHALPISKVFKLDSSLERIQELRHDPSNPESFSGRFIRTFFSDGAGSILMAGQSEPLEKYNPSNSTFTRIPITQTIDPYAGYMDSNGTLWLGASFGGIIEKYDLKSGTYEKLSGVAGGTVNCIVEDQYHNLWVASNGGLTRIKLKSGVIDYFRHDPLDPRSLSSNTVNQIHIDANHDIWLATARGLSKMEQGTENTIPKFRHWSKSQSGLPHEVVLTIVDGGDGSLWLACGNQLSHFHPSKNTFKNYDQGDGLTGKHFIGAYSMPSKGLRAADGKIFFSTNSGLVTFHPDSLRENAYAPSIILTALSIHNQPVPVKGSSADTLSSSSPLERSINYEHELRLSHHDNDFNIDFTALNFINPENNRYKYKLEPYETDWIETSANNRSARYTNISPGSYTFRVIGSNNDGVWNEEGASLSIHIKPPWWQSVWAYMFYVTSFFSIIMFWRHYENRRLKLKHRADYLSELDELKTKFFTNISHEFRTPITLILAPIKELYAKTNNNEQKHLFETMLRNGQRLLRLINQLLDLSKLESGKMTLQSRPEDIVRFLQEIASSYESLAVYKQIKYFFYSEVQELIVTFDHDKLEDVIHNILSNAFKFTNKDGQVILHFKTNKKSAIITVKDTGIGIPANLVDKVFDRFYQIDNSHTRNYEGSGLGMALAKELIELHNGRVLLESEQGKGTTVTVILPLGKAHGLSETIRQEKDVEKEKTSGQTDILLEEAVPAKAEGAPSLDKPLLLIVEDNTDMRNYIRKTLCKDYQIEEAADGKEGLRKTEERMPDLVITDVMMPEMDGYQLCEQVKTHEVTSHIPVIILTAKADRASKLTGLQFGADDYLPKPFDAEELILIVRNRIDEKKRMRARFSREIILEPTQLLVNSMDEKFLQKVMKLIETHIEDENFSIESFAQEVGYSRMQFYRKIKALTGQSPSHFVRTIRLKRAAQLLMSQSDTVTQIAYSVGFRSLAYFNKCFKDQFGTTPSQFHLTKQTNA